MFLRFGKDMLGMEILLEAKVWVEARLLQNDEEYFIRLAKVLRVWLQSSLTSLEQKWSVVETVKLISSIDKGHGKSRFVQCLTFENEKSEDVGIILVCSNWFHVNQ